MSSKSVHKFLTYFADITLYGDITSLAELNIGNCMQSFAAFSQLFFSVTDDFHSHERQWHNQKFLPFCPFPLLVFPFLSVLPLSWK